MGNVKTHHAADHRAAHEQLPNLMHFGCSFGGDRFGGASVGGARSGPHVNATALNEV